MRKRLLKLGSFVLAGALCGALATPVLAEKEKSSADFTVGHDEHRALTIDAGEEKPSADLTVGFYSQYIWRGWELSRDSLVIQPSMTVSYKGFSANVWGNLDTDQNEHFGDETSNWNETDFTLSYEGSVDKVGYSLGYIYYDLEGAEDTQEFYAGAGLDILLAPTLTVYRDTDTSPGWYITLGVSHSFPVTEKYSLDLGLQVSYWDVDDESTYADPDDSGDAYSNFHDGILSAAMSFPVGEYFTITPELYYVFPLSDDAEDFMKDESVSGDDDDFIYGGVSVSFAF